MCHLFSGIPQEDTEGETRSVRLSGHVTSIRLEAAFWQTLESLAESQSMSLSKFLTTLHDGVLELHGEVRNFASLLRCACLVHLRGAPALALSGGERRRCEIARCLASDPGYLLLDEPFAGVDPIAVGDIRDLVAALKTRGLGVLITDHNVRETLDIVDRACIIYGGQVLFAGTPEALVADENVRRLYLGESFTL